MQKPSDASTKRTYVRLNFTQEQEEQLIDFVKTKKSRLVQEVRQS